ncbi:MAG: CvpA family protein [Nitrosomonadales bacterium]
MTGFDYSVFGILLLSLLLGWWRGLVYEVLSLLGVGGGLDGGTDVCCGAAPYMPVALGAESARTTAAFVVLFVATLIICSIVTWLLSKLVKWVGLGWLDGLLGMLFGMVRGVLIVLLLVVLAGMTHFPQESFWRNSWSGKLLENVALNIKAWLPDSCGAAGAFLIRDVYKINSGCL